MSVFVPTRVRAYCIRESPDIELVNSDCSRLDFASVHSASYDVVELIRNMVI